LGALRPEGTCSKFESHSSRHVGTLGKSFTRSCLQRFGVLIPAQMNAVVENASKYNVVAGLKRRSRKFRTE